MQPSILDPSALKIADFTYELPDEKIAKFPLANRADSKLLIFNKGQIKTDNYQYLDKHLPQDSLLIFNKTKVIHARLLFQKETGSKIEIFCLEPDVRYASLTQAMQSENEVFWKCMVGGASKWKNGQELKITLDKETEQIILKAVIAQKAEGYFIIKFNWQSIRKETNNIQNLTFSEVLQVFGHLPIPPYLNRKAEEKDEETYQTVFATEEGSVAAPTAALHFTNDLFSALANKGIQKDFLTLHVGAGTFKPVQSAIMENHDMHSEWIEISIDFLKNLLTAIQQNKKIIPIGTTSLRSLESLFWIGVKIARSEWDPRDETGVTQWYPYRNPSLLSIEESIEYIINYLQEHKQEKLITKTQILIAPGYDFKLIDGLITNFHQPQSTLLLLVAALVGRDWKKIYDYALNHDFRFLSYGDGCLLWT